MAFKIMRSGCLLRSLGYCFMTAKGFENKFHHQRNCLFLKEAGQFFFVKCPQVKRNKKCPKNKASSVYKQMNFSI